MKISNSSVSNSCMMINIQQLKSEKGREMQNNCMDTKRKKLFIGLLVLQLIIIVLQILSGQFYIALTSTIFRVVVLLVSNFCLSSNMAYMYIFICIITALYIFDAIGLFLVGHSKLNIIQNILAILAFALVLFASYVGFLFAKELELEGGSSQGFGAFNFASINQDQGRNNSATNSYGGTNYLYQNGPNNQQNQGVNTLRNINQNQNQNQRGSSNFQPFQGQGYSLN